MPPLSVFGGWMNGWIDRYFPPTLPVMLSAKLGSALPLCAVTAFATSATLDARATIYFPAYVRYCFGLHHVWLVVSNGALSFCSCVWRLFVVWDALCDARIRVQLSTAIEHHEERRRGRGCPCCMSTSIYIHSRDMTAVLAQR